MLDPHILLRGVIIFVARICDVSIVTIRTIVTAQGRTFISFALAIFEICIWVIVVSAVVNPNKDQPLIVVFVRSAAPPALWWGTWWHKIWLSER